MCGYVALISEKILNKAHFEKMRDVLFHRGPDDLGYWSDEEAKVQLGFRRLAILDLSQNGHQPMLSSSQKWVIVFNGEIYNHEYLKSLIPNHKWRGHSDTEILIEVLEKLGIQKTISELHGMFSFFAYNIEDKKIYLARDRFGEKPLYYGVINQDFVVGSELKSIFAHPEYKLEIDKKGLNTYFEYSYIPSNYSIDKNIKKLLPGSFLEINLNDYINDCKREPVSFWLPPTNVVSIDKDHVVLELEKRLFEVLEQMMMSDVPLGAFLSGGIDSSLIVALMQKVSNKPIKTFTIGFKDKEYDESEYAKKIAEVLKTDHHEKILTVDDLKILIPEVLKAYDEPFADTSCIPTFALCQFARKYVTVALSGDGGDEMFLGYNRYIYAQKMKKFKTIPYPLIKSLIPVIKSVPEKIWRIAAKSTGISEIHLKVDRAIRFLESNNDYSQNLHSMIKTSSKPLMNEISSYEPRGFLKVGDIVTDLNRQDLLNYLPDDIMTKVDRASMAVSLETRAPYLHPQISEWAIQLPNSLKIGKAPLKKLLARHLDKKLFDRPKKGFSLPLERWIEESDTAMFKSGNFGADERWKRLLAKKYLS